MTQGDWFWHELHTDDAEAAKKFYGAVVGWDTNKVDMGKGDYHLWQHGGTNHGGMVHTAALPENERLPIGWYVYINVDDVDASVAKARGLGAKVLIPPYDLAEVGRMSLIEDPQGAKAFLMRGAHQED
jgi:predicted enzyme related to lactoylglutathione lyase